MGEEEDPSTLTQSVGTQTEDLPCQSTPPTLPLKLNGIRCLVEPISAFYQFLPRASGTSSFVPAQLLSTGQACTLRIVSKEKVVTEKMSRGLVADLLLQISSLDHPNILRPFELLEDFNHFYISYPALSPLLPYLTQASLPESLYATILAQLLSALSFAHNHQCLHKNLDLDCLFLRSNPTSTSIDICLGDFEKQLEGRRYHVSAFEAPETLGVESGDKADVWSCGVIMYHLLSGTTPFHPIKYTIMVKRGTAMKVTKPKSEVSDEAWDLLLSMLQWRPEQRPSLAQCLLHPWIRQTQISSPSLPCKVIKNMLLAMSSQKPRSMLREAIKNYIIFRVEKSENLDQMTAMFSYFDSNSDGKISKSELLTGLRKWLPEDKAQQKAQQVMATADTNSSGCIDYSEFLLSTLNEDSLLSTPNLLAAFNSLDRDHSGKVSLQELRDVFMLSTCGSKQQAWRELMREVDQDGDEQINFTEFKRLMVGK